MTTRQLADYAQSVYDLWLGTMRMLAPLAPGIGFASALPTTTPEGLATAFNRTHGALADALGFGPARQLYTAWQQTLAAAAERQEARANYALLVQFASGQGLQRLISRLAGIADKGEQVDSIRSLQKLWAACTEEAVHETLQSDPGLAATAALTRASMAYRNSVRHATSIVADTLDIATRAELDDAYREIQALKRELRASRTRDDVMASAPVAASAPTRRPRAPRAARPRGERSET